jgi:hypothetical protein
MRHVGRCARQRRGATDAESRSSNSFHVEDWAVAAVLLRLNSNETAGMLTFASSGRRTQYFQRR